MTLPTPPKTADPFVKVVVWEGPASALAARLGIPPSAINGLLIRNARKTTDGYVIDAPSSRTLTLARCLLTRLPEGAKESLDR